MSNCKMLIINPQTPPTTQKQTLPNNITKKGTKIAKAKGLKLQKTRNFSNRKSKIVQIGNAKCLSCKKTIFLKLLK